MNKAAQPTSTVCDPYAPLTARRTPRWRLRRIAIGAAIGASFPLLAFAAASVIQTIGSLL